MIRVSEFSGATAGQRIQSALSSLPPSGGVVDCRSVVGEQMLDVDVFSGFDPRPVTIHFGPAEFVLTEPQQIPSWCRLVFHNTRIRLADSSVPYAFVQQRTGGQARFVAGSRSIEMRNGTEKYFFQGAPVAVFGFTPICGGTDATTLAAPFSWDDDDRPDITVSSVAGFPTTNPAAQRLKIGQGVYGYTAIDQDQSRFTGVMRIGGTAIVDVPSGVPVTRSIYRMFVAEEVVDNIVTLNEPVDFSAGFISVLTGPMHVALEGMLCIDASEGHEGGGGISADVLRYWYIGPGITVYAPQRDGVRVNGALDSDIRVRVLRANNRGLNVSRLCDRVYSSPSLAGNAAGDLLVMEDRSNAADTLDGPSMNCFSESDVVNAGGNGNAAALIEGTCGCKVQLRRPTGYAGYAVRVNSTQWKVVGMLPLTTVDVVAPDVSSAVVANPGHAAYADGGNLFWWRQPAVEMAATSPGASGNTFDGPQKWTKLGTSSTVTPNPVTTVLEIVVPTAGVTVDEPEFVPWPGSLLRLVFVNQTGQSGGAITWDSIYRLAGTFASPGAGERKAIQFCVAGSAWVETART